MKISSLLNNENILKQLNLTDVSSDDCVLILKEPNEITLTKDDLQKPISTYATVDNELIHFQISISVQITKHDDKKQIKIPLSNRNITIEQLLNLTEKSIDVYKYLATNDTKRIINSNEILSNLNKTKFILVKENETCLISIKKSNNVQQVDNNEEESEKLQRFISFATIADINKENQEDILHKYLMYSNDFVPSKNTQLISFLSVSPIQFTMINENLPVTVIIQNKEINKSIQFNCEDSITVQRLCEIACQLCCLNNKYYCLSMDDDTELTDSTLSLKDITDENATEISFKLVSTASLYCSINYSNQIIKLPCCQDTLLMTIIKEVLQILNKSEDNMDMYELIALDDDRTEIDFNCKLDDVLALFPNGLTTISFELKNKGD
ncbi:unnamed protein product [Rotaria sp. Silwood2]|nr:unnamed protein product [Rotaria sp. Silwood2]